MLFKLWRKKNLRALCTTFWVGSKLLFWTCFALNWGETEAFCGFFVEHFYLTDILFKFYWKCWGKNVKEYLTGEWKFLMLSLRFKVMEILSKKHDNKNVIGRFSFFFKRSLIRRLEITNHLKQLFPQIKLRFLRFWDYITTHRFPLANLYKLYGKGVKTIFLNNLWTKTYLH